MVPKKVKKRLWNYGLVYQADILSRIARGKAGRTGFEEVNGQAPEISGWLNFYFYDCVLWLDKSHSSTMKNSIIPGIWLGISCKIGGNI